MSQLQKSQSHVDHKGIQKAKLSQGHDLAKNAKAKEQEVRKVPWRILEIFL